MHPVIVNLVGSIFNNPVAHPSAFFELSEVKSVGGYQVQPPLEDYDLWSKLPPTSQIINHPEVLTYYRKHFDQITTNVNRPYLDLCVIQLRFAKRLVSSAPILILILPIILLFIVIPLNVLKYILARIEKLFT